MDVRSRARVAVALTGLLACLAGCATVTVGTAQPGSSLHSAGGADNGATGGSESAKPGPGNLYGAPRVTQPLDVTKYIKNPCSTLTTAQLHGLHLTKAGVPDQDAQGSTCTFSPKYDVVYDVAFNVHFDEGQPTGLANAYWYANGTAFTTNYMKRLPDIDGVPEVTEPMQNTGGDCYIYLGATDQISFATGVTVSSSAEPQYRTACSIAQQLAKDITETMRSGK
jgi:Protein of unknown function (DUF3558)